MVRLANARLKNSIALALAAMLAAACGGKADSSGELDGHDAASSFQEDSSDWGQVIFGPRPAAEERTAVSNGDRDES